MDQGLSKDFLVGLSNFIEATINKKVSDEVAANSKKMGDEIKELKEKLAALEAKKAAKAAKGGVSNRSGSKKGGKTALLETDSQGSKKQEAGNARPRVWSKNVSSSGAAEASHAPSSIPKPTKLSKDPQSATGLKKAPLNPGKVGGANYKYVPKGGNSPTAAQEGANAAAAKKSATVKKQGE